MCQLTRQFVFLFLWLAVSRSSEAFPSLLAQNKDLFLRSDSGFHNSESEPGLDDEPVLMFTPTQLLGVGLGLHYQNSDYYYYPHFNVELSLSRLLAVGFFLDFRYSSGNGAWTLSSDGLISINFYPLGKFDKLLLRLAGGLNTARPGNASPSFQFRATASGYLGWRFLIKDSYTPVSLSLLLGYQHIFDNPISQQFPLALFEIGVLQ